MKYLTLTLVLTLFILTGASLFSQKINLSSDNPSVKVVKIFDQIMLDGMLEEAVWQKIEPAKNFAQTFHADSVLTEFDTEIYLAYDEQFLYVGLRCKAKGNELITPSLRRDYDFFGNDNFTILFDTYNDKTNAIVFGINPFGVRREALVSNGGQQGRNFDDSWDNKWDGEAKIANNEWTAEMAIPFKTLRYNEGSQKWRMNAYRYDTQTNQISSWISIPQNRFTIDLGFMGDMVWEEPLKKPSKNISLIPYASGAITHDLENNESAKTDWNIGGDAKIALTSGLNLDLTINPDFSQVEVDQQVTNLDRFEIFFPEKRQFFLENADLFGGFGISRVNPFFSRRIGVAIDTATGQNIQNTILYGARLSGKLNEKLRVGLLNMQTAKQEENDLPSINYTVATAEHRVFDRSSIAVMFVNKQAINSEDFGGSINDYNRIGGLEYRLASKNNYWKGKTSIMKSFTPGVEADDVAHFFQLEYNKRRYRVEWAHLYIQNNFNAEVGFVPRKDVFMGSPEAEINFYPKDSKISRHTLGFDSRFFFKIDEEKSPFLNSYDIEEINFEPYWEFNFRNSARLNFMADYKNLTLLDDFDPTRIQEDGVFLAAGSEHSWLSFSVRYQSDQRKKFNYRIRPSVGSFYNGFRTGVRGSFTFRYQPFGFISLDYNYNHINLDGNFETANLWLIGPRVDITFTKKIFLTTFFQYNNQLDNLNINARFQWRFKPASDFFIVYTDNYLTSPFDQFASRNRALVAKFTYWFNL